MADGFDPGGATLCVCCVDGGRSRAATDTVRIALGDRSGTVDLCEEHSASLRAAVEPVLAASSRRSRRRPSSQSVPRLRSGEDREQIRAWARAQGLPVSASGTISAAVLDRYRSDLAGPGSAGAGGADHETGIRLPRDPEPVGGLVDMMVLP